MRPIDVDKLLEELNNGNTKYECVIDIPGRTSVQKVIDITIKAYRKLIFESIKNQPTIESDKWIPVEERLPEECGYYLCTVKWDEKDRSAVLYFSKIENEWMEENECGFFEGLNQECISAWKNQEEPYKPEGEKE